MSKGVKERVNAIEKKALTEIPAIMQSVTGSSDEAGMAKYRNARQELNIKVIETVLGADISEGKKAGEWKVKYGKKLPNVSELGKICQIMDEYTEKYEVPFYAKFISNAAVPAPVATTADAAVEAEGQENDLSIPKEEVMYTAKYKKLGRIDKINKKKMKEELFQHNLVSEFIDSAAVMVIASYGEKIRKKQNLTTTLIVGGISLVVVGGVITGICIANSKKHKNDVDDPDVDIDIDTSDIELAGELDDNNAPVVEIA